MVLCVTALLAGCDKLGGDGDLVKMSCTKKVKGTIKVPKTGKVCASATVYDCFELKDERTGWMVSVDTGFPAPTSPEKAIEYFKANAALESAGKPIKLGTGDYLVPAIYEGKSVPELHGYKRLAENVSVSCTVFGAVTPELLAQLEKSCRSFERAK